MLFFSLSFFFFFLYSLEAGVRLDTLSFLLIFLFSKYEGGWREGGEPFWLEPCLVSQVTF